MTFHILKGDSCRAMLLLNKKIIRSEIENFNMAYTKSAQSLATKFACHNARTYDFQRKSYVRAL